MVPKNTERVIIHADNKIRLNVELWFFSTNQTNDIIYILWFNFFYSPQASVRKRNVTELLIDHMQLLLYYLTPPSKCLVV